MLIAQLKDGVVNAVADYQSLYPQTSFPQSGPTDEWMIENNCMFVNVFKPYDQNTEKLVSVSPYIESNDHTHWVYTVIVEPLTPEEIAQREEAAKQANKAQASSLLSATDWTAIASVADPAESNPYLTNRQDFLTYRSALRQIAVNPPVMVTEWPVKPDEVWATV